jgi:Zn-dependent protease with chaperone function
MANTLPESIEPYENISSKAYEHPADRAATAALKAVPMLDTVVRKLIEWQYERALRQLYLGNSIKVGEHQLPDLWASHTGVCRVLDMERPDLYLAYQIPGGAAAIGSTNPIIVFDSQLRQWLGPGEQRAVIAHELGHVLSDHLVYTTALQILLSVTMPLPFFLGIPFRAVKAVLLEWFRAAELTCDRAATLAVRDPQIVCRSLMVISAGMPADKLNLDAFMAQAMEYESWDDPSDRVRRFFNEINQTHPYSVRRVSEIMKWVQSGEYDRIIRGEYRRRDDPTDVRQEAGDAVNFYAERFRAIFRETGENLTKAGSQIGGVADQLADWIRARGGPGGGGGGSGSGGSGASGSGSGGSGSGGSGASGRPGSDSPGGDVFGDEFDDEA